LSLQYRVACFLTHHLPLTIRQTKTLVYQPAAKDQLG